MYKNLKIIEIQGRKIGEGFPCFVIAEAGINHNGDIDMAMELVKMAKEVGADCIKFQTFSTEACESRNSTIPGYFDGRITETDKLDWSKSLELSREEFKKLKTCCDELAIIFLSTACDIPSLELLVEIGVDALKIGSSDTNNTCLLQAVGETGLPVILSTGMSSLEDVDHAFSALQSNGTTQIALLQCTSQYPVPFDQINLRAMNTLRDSFNVPVGFSDHSSGIHVSVASIALGANIIEKHFTLSSDLPGVDHAASIEPHEFREMVWQIREVEKALGNGTKKIMEAERENVTSMRKSLVAAENISDGTILAQEHITVKRPGTGLPPTRIHEVIGRKTKSDINKDEMIIFDDLI